MCHHPLETATPASLRDLNCRRCPGPSALPLLSQMLNPTLRWNSSQLSTMPVMESCASRQLHPERLRPDRWTTAEHRNWRRPRLETFSRQLPPQFLSLPRHPPHRQQKRPTLLLTIVPNWFLKIRTLFRKPPATYGRWFSLSWVLYAFPSGCATFLAYATKTLGGSGCPEPQLPCAM